MASRIGIDFGTSKTIAAWFDELTGSVETLRNSDGLEATPSVVYYGSGQVLVGEPARRMLEQHADAARLFARFKGSIADAGRVGSNSYATPAMAASELFRKIRTDAEQLSFHGAVSSASITCPATFSQAERDSLAEAARQGGFLDVEVVDEAAAVALAYGELGAASGRYVLVYDFGAGSCDIFVLERLREGGYGVASPPMGLRVGGDDLDRALYDFIDAQVRSELGRAISTDGSLDLRVLDRCRAAKESLSNEESCTLETTLASSSGAVPLTCSITRSDFESIDAVKQVIDRTAQLAKRTAESSAASGKPIDTAIVIGGSSYIPAVICALNSALPVPVKPWDRRGVAAAVGATLYGIAQSDRSTVAQGTQSTSRTATDYAPGHGGGNDHAIVQSRDVEDHVSDGRQVHDAAATPRAISAESVGYGVRLPQPSTPTRQRHHQAPLTMGTAQPSAGRGPSMAGGVAGLIALLTAGAIITAIILGNRNKSDALPAVPPSNPVVARGIPQPITTAGAPTPTYPPVIPHKQGWELHEYADLGFKIECPASWHASRTTKSTTDTIKFTSGDSNIFCEVELVRGVVKQEIASQWNLLDMQLQRSYGAKYNKIDIVKSTLGGSDAATWEFTLKLKSGVTSERHDTGTFHNGNSMAVMSVAPESNYKELQDVFDHILKSFQFE